MTKKKAKAEEVETTEPVLIDPFVGAEEDDLMDMQYIQDENTTTMIETHPPETVADAELLAEQKAAEEAKDAKDDDGEDVGEPEAEKDEDDAVAEEETAEEEPAEEEPAEEEVLDEDGVKVPKNRFDKVNERMKDAESKVESLEKQLEGLVEEKNAPEPAPPYDYATKEVEAMDALLEGDQDKYKALRAEIRLAERAETLAEAKKVADTGDVQSRDDIAFSEAGDLIEAEYPAFSTTSEDYNAAAREEMIDLYVGYVQSGRYTRVEALQRAADRSAKLNDIVGVEDPVVPDNVVKIKPTNVKEKVAIANNQPPEIKGKAEGEEEPTLDINSMSDEEFDNMPVSTKRRLRGDTV